MKIEPTGDFPEQPAGFAHYRGYYDRTIFYSPIDKFCILSIRTDDKRVPEPCRSNQSDRDHEIRFTVTGYDLPRVPSVEILWEGDWQHSKYGPRLQITQWDEIVPLTREGILNYLSSGLIKGIGPRTAEAIVDRFGLDTLNIFENHPNELLVIRGITKERLEEMKQSYAESRALRNLMTFLAPFQITPKAAQSIYQYFGTKSIEILRNNPYELCHVPGFGFLRVDSIVQKNGGKLTAPSRIKAAILFALENNKLRGGHLYVEQDQLLEEAFDLLNKNIPFPELRVGRNSIGQQFQELLIQGDIIATRSCIYLKKSFELENETARCVAQILTEHLDHKNVAAALSIVKKRIGIALSEKQEAAVFAAFQHNLSIITGGPGTGKTTVLRAILEVYQMMYPASGILLAAPTGRASRRMAESSGYDGARTLHSALRLGVEDCTLEEEERSTLNVGLIIVDETSMVDMWLAKQLFSRIAPGTKVILVGDADQLPSVGAGNVFRELIDCGEIPVTVLDQIFRQAETSRIVYNSKYINEAKTNLLYGDDFVFVKTRNQHDAAAAVCDTYYQLITEFGIDRVMILAPFRNDGEASANSLNAVIREHLNPCDPTKKEVKGNNKETFRVGDRVMQTKNLNDIELFDADGAAAGVGVFNGDIGTIRAIDETSVTVDFDGRYTFAEMLQLWHAPKQYVQLYVKLTPLAVDQRLLTIRQLLKHALLDTALSEDEDRMEQLAHCLLQETFDRWYRGEFAHIRGLKRRTAVQLLEHYGEVQRFVPDFRSESDAVFAVRNAGRLPEYSTWAQLRSEILTADQDWLYLKEQMNYSDAFVAENQEHIVDFLLRGGSAMVRPLYDYISIKKDREALRRIVQAELMGQFYTLKYFMEDLQHELQYPIGKGQEELWKQNLSMERNGRSVEEVDDFYNTLQIGELPHTTCLSYLYGSCRECLLAAFDSNKKMILGYQDGAVVARACIRLTKGSFQDPRYSDFTFADLVNEDEKERKPAGQERLVLFLENVYISSTNPKDAQELQKLMIKLVCEKADHMGALPVLARSYLHTCPDKEYVDAALYMYISKSKSGKQYLDSLGGTAGTSDEDTYERRTFGIRKRDLDAAAATT